MTTRTLTRAALAAILLLASMSAIAAEAKDPEVAAIEATIGKYFQAHATGDGAFIREAFHPEGKMMWVKDAKLASRTAEEFASGFSGKAAPDEAQRKRTIESIDRTGHVAIAKITLDYPAVKFTDYFMLAKTDGQWRIIAKGYHREAPQKK